jgi:hypothetical protein
LSHPKTISKNTQSIVYQINYKTRAKVVPKSGQHFLEVIFQKKYC